MNTPAVHGLEDVSEEYDTFLTTPVVWRAANNSELPKRVMLRLSRVQGAGFHGTAIIRPNWNKQRNGESRS